MSTRVFRRQDKFQKSHFYEARKIEADEHGVRVWFADQSSWPPPGWKQSLGAVRSFEEECEATLARGYVEVDAMRGQPLAPRSEADVLADLRRLNPFSAFPALQAHLVTARKPTGTLEALLATLDAIERELDEHDRPFPGEQRPPDWGALGAYRAHYRRLLGLAQAGEALAPELLGYRYSV